MEKLKGLLAEQIETILSTYNPYKDELSEEQKKDLQGFEECLSILKGGK